MDGTTPQILARKATHDDAVAIYELLVVMREEGRYPEENPDKAMNAILDVIERGVAVAIERAGKMIASAGLIVTTWWFADAQFLTDLWVFVHPEHRKSRAAILLMRAMQGVAVATKLPLRVQNGTLVETDKKNRFFARYMQPVGESFIWRPPAET